MKGGDNRPFGRAGRALQRAGPTLQPVDKHHERLRPSSPAPLVSTSRANPYFFFATPNAASFAAISFPAVEVLIVFSIAWIVPSIPM